MQQGPFDAAFGEDSRINQVILARCGRRQGQRGGAYATSNLNRRAERLDLYGRGRCPFYLRSCVGDIVVSTDCLQHDVDATAFDYALGQVPGQPLAWTADERLRELALGAAQELDGVQVT